VSNGPPVGSDGVVAVQSKAEAGTNVARPIFRPCACRKSNPDIFVMQSAEDWAAKNTPCPFYGAR
jgi:hypothetical protein